MKDKARCIKACPEDIFIHEYIPVGAILKIEELKNGVMVLTRLDPYGYKEIICQIDCIFFKEHFILI